MQNKSFDESGLQFAWDSTSIKLAEECLMHYKLKMLDGWAPRGKSVHLRFGGLYASALEHYHKHLVQGFTPDNALLLIVQEAMIESWDHERDENGVRIEGTGSAWDPNHNTKTRENLIRTIVWYVDHFANDPLHVARMPDGSPAVECSIALPVDDGIVFTGHFDRVVEYGSDVMVMDQKTSGSTISSYYFAAFEPDVQMSMYTFLGRAALKVPVSGVIIDAAQIAVGFTRFERGMTFRTTAQLDEWYDYTMHTIERARKATREQYFPMNRTACSNYGGCEFRKICSKSPEHRESFLRGDYERAERWDPIKRR